MIDIVDKLRHVIAHLAVPEEILLGVPVLREALAEIERLRGAEGAK